MSRLAERQAAFTLRGRIALIAMAVTAGWVLVLTVGFNLALSAQLGQQADSLLRTRAEAVATTVEFSREGQVSVREVRGDAAVDVDTWVLAGGRIVEGPPGNGNLDAAARALAGRGQRSVTDGTDSSMRLFAFPVVNRGAQVATVVTSVSLTPYRQTARLAVIGSVLLALLLMAGVYVIVRLSMDRALRPVQDMIGQAGRWSADDVDRRFGSARRPQELDDLARTLDGVLDRISAVLRHEKVFSEPISHELRTPLAAVIAEVELVGESAAKGSGPGRPELAESVQRIAAAAERMAGILDTLMAAARSDTARPTGRCDARTTLRDLLRARAAAAAAPTSGRRAGAPVPRLAVRVPAGLIVGVDAAVLHRLVSPLLDNAVRYARRSVIVTAAQDEGQVEVTVRDDGPGIAETDLPKVFGPGWRADPTDRHDGAGLGLALVHRLATAAAGSVRAEAGPGGTVTVRLPAG
jgi:signal transduction histidine kinase